MIILIILPIPVAPGGIADDGYFGKNNSLSSSLLRFES